MSERRASQITELGEGAAKSNKPQKLASLEQRLERYHQENIQWITLPDEPALDDELVEELNVLIEELRSKLGSPGVSPALKGFIERQLQIIERALSRIPFTGATGLGNVLRECEVYSRPSPKFAEEYEPSDEDKTVTDKFRYLFNKFGQMTDTVLKLSDYYDAGSNIVEVVDKITSVVSS